MNFKSVSTIGLLGALIVTSGTLPANAQISKSGDGYLLRMKYKQGEKTNYTMTMSSSMMPQPMKLMMSSVVKKVAGTSATIEFTSTPPAGLGGGKPQVGTVTMDNRGRVVSGGSGPAQQFSNIQLPEKPIKVGQSWSGTIAPGQGMNITPTYKFLGTKMVGSIECAQIGVTMTSSGGQVSISGTGTMYLRTADASLQSGKIETAAVVTMPAQNGGKPKPTTIKQSIVFTRS